MNSQTAADFCPQCKYILELPEVLDTIECNRCGFKCSISEYEPKYIITTIQMEPKSWLQLHKEEIVDNNHTRATILNDCPKCGHDKMYFWTAQIRSADEGSTVFYECVSCAFRYQQNN